MLQPWCLLASGPSHTVPRPLYNIYHQIGACCDTRPYANRQDAILQTLRENRAELLAREGYSEDDTIRLLITRSGLPGASGVASPFRARSQPQPPGRDNLRPPGQPGRRTALPDYPGGQAAGNRF